MTNKAFFWVLFLALNVAAFLFYKHNQLAPLVPEVSEAKLTDAPASTSQPAPLVNFTYKSTPRQQADISPVRTTDELLQQMVDLQKSTDHEKLLALLAELVKSNPLAAARFAESVTAEYGREVILLRLAQWWTAQDRVAAEKWALQLTDETERQSVLSGICFQVAQTDVRHAVQLGERYDFGEMTGAVMANLVQRWAVQDYAEAADWVQKKPPGEFRDGMYARLAYLQSKSSPTEAAIMVVEQIPPGLIQTEAVISLLHQWFLRDMAGAAAWVDQFPAGDLKVRAENEMSGIAGRADTR